MCIPIMAGVALAGAAMSAKGQMDAGNAAKNSADYNAAMGEFAARDALSRVEDDKQDLAQLYTRERSTGRTQIGSSGVRVGTGSGLDWENDLIENYVFDKATLSDNAALEADALRRGVALERAKGESALAASRTAAAGSAISGIGAVAGRWYTPKSAGAPSPVAAPVQRGTVTVRGTTVPDYSDPSKMSPYKPR